MIEYSKHNYECPFSNETGPTPIRFITHGDFMQKNRVLSFKDSFEIFEKLCQGFGFIFQK